MLLIICTILGCAGAFSTYSVKKSQMTPWQQAQKIDFDKQTGSTKFQAILDSAILGAMTFAISAITISFVYKLYITKKK